MSIDVVVHARPGEVVDFEAFCTYPDWSVALDGYVHGPSRWDESNRHVTFDHHDNCDRYATRATCEQVALAVQAGLLDTWERAGCRTAMAWINDPDPDVALSVWLLRHPEHVSNRDVAALIRCEGAIDTSGGCLVPGEAEPFELLGWVVEPWLRWRQGLDGRNGIAAVVEAVGERLDRFAAGRGEKARLDEAFEVLARHGRIAAVTEHTPLARCRYAAAGISTFVAVRQRLEAHLRDVTVGRVSPWEGPDLARAWDVLNDAEGIPPGSKDRWGGSDMIGGSPRSRGTGLDLDDVMSIIAAHE
jgi:hypothetical protein